MKLINCLFAIPDICLALSPFSCTSDGVQDDNVDKHAVTLVDQDHPLT